MDDEPERVPTSPVDDGDRKSPADDADENLQSPQPDDADENLQSPQPDDADENLQSPQPDDAGRRSKSTIQGEAEEEALPPSPVLDEEEIQEDRDTNINAGEDYQVDQSEDGPPGDTEPEEDTEKPEGEEEEVLTGQREAEEETHKHVEEPRSEKDSEVPTEVEPQINKGKSENEDLPETQQSQLSEISEKSKPQSPTLQTETLDSVQKSMTIPDAPRLPTPDRKESTMEGTMSNTALVDSFCLALQSTHYRLNRKDLLKNMIWSFGLNRSVPVLNLTDNTRKVIMYTCAHVGILYDFKSNRQHILQGHSSPVYCTCVSEDKRWLATGDKGKDSMVIVWDTYTGIPVQTIFEISKDGGVVSMAMTPDARYLATLSAAKKQVLALWNWTVDGETPMCTVELKPEFGVQNFIFFNPEDIHYLVTNSDSQVIFYEWDTGRMEYFAPPLTDHDFNKPVGRYSQSIFQLKSSRALTATSIGNLVVWDSNKPLTKVVSTEPSANKKALKIIKLQDRGINVLTITDRFIVVGDVAGHVKFFDQSLKLVHWYQDFHLGPVSSVSFAYYPEFQPLAKEGTNFPPDATIEAKQFIIQDFVVGSSIAVFGNITADGSKVQIIHREHDAAIHALAPHPFKPYVIIGSYSGLLKIWDYEKKEVLVSRVFDRGNLIRCCAYDPKGAYIAVGFVNGTVRILDSITLDDELQEPFRYAKDAITHIEFSHDSQYLATADGEYTVSVFIKRKIIEGDPYTYLGRYRAHYKPIKDIMFGVQLDANVPRLLSLGEDRVLVEYDLENSSKDELKIASVDRIEQSAVPQCMTWYPPITKEHFIVTTNDQYKFKLYNSTTKMCRKTILGPTYGSPVQRISIVPTKDPARDKRYLAYCTKDKVGLHILPLDGNPHNAMALIAHPGGVAYMVTSYDGKYVFTAGGSDASVHMWEININALEAQAKLGGEDLIPFYGLLDGGREGELFAELEDYFYYAQIRSQGVNALEKRNVSTNISLTEVPFVMRAMGFYPSEQEIEDMLNEVKFSRYVETGQNVEDIDLGDFIKLYINHRPAFGLSPEKLKWAFETLGIPTDQGKAIERGDLLDLLQSQGEHMTEYELAEYLTTLLGFNPEGGSSELHEFDTSEAGDMIDQSLPQNITAEMFASEVLGFSMFNDVVAKEEKSDS